METHCHSCTEELPTDGAIALCGKCKKGFHFDCTTISESSWRSLGPDRRKAWRCANCKEDKNKKLKDSQLFTQSQGERVSDGTGDCTSEILIKLEEYEKKMQKNFKDLDTGIKNKLADFETNLNFYGEKVEEAVRTVKAMEQKYVLMENRIEKSEQENKELKKRLRNMEIQMMDYSQKEFKNKLEIANIKDANVNASTVVDVVLEKAGFSSGEILHKEEKVTKKVENGLMKTSIVAEFRTQDERNKVLQKIKTAKVYSKLGNAVNQDESYVFINEALCPEYKKIFYEANKLKKDKKLAYLWIKDGKILAKKTTESSVMRLSSTDDLGKV
uniref:PHD-type domain-containing protein n=1 Tax=Cacopsylla melanoneura TaxID=428564 RepID=A0A8D8TWB4_9HEMI